MILQYINFVVDYALILGFHSKFQQLWNCFSFEGEFCCTRFTIKRKCPTATEFYFFYK